MENKGLGLRHIPNSAPETISNSKPVENEILVTKDEGRLVVSQVGVPDAEQVAREVPFRDETFEIGREDSRGLSRISNEVVLNPVGELGSQWGAAAVLSYDGSEALVAADAFGATAQGRVSLISTITGDEISSLPNSTLSDGDQFGSVIAASGALSRAVVAKGGVKTFSVLNRSEDAYTEIQELSSGSGYVTALAVSFDGAWLAVGSDAAAGKVDLYQYSLGAESYVLVDTLTADDGVSGDSFGESVAFFEGSDGGLDLLVGSPSATVGGEAEAGAAYIFSDLGVGYVQTQKLSAPSRYAGDKFGSSAASSSGVIVIGSKGRTVDGKVEAGAAFAFEKAESGAFESTQEISTSLVGEYSEFGSALSFSNDFLAVGADKSSGLTPNAGAVFIYEYRSSVFHFVAEIKPSFSKANVFFGGSVSFDSTGQILLAGAIGSNEGTGGAGVFSSVSGWKKALRELTFEQLVSGDFVEGVISASTLQRYFDYRSLEGRLKEELIAEIGGSAWLGIDGAAPSASLTANTVSGDAPLAVTLSNASSAGDSPIESYVLSFSDGRASVNWDGEDYQFSIADINTSVTVTVLVTDIAGNTGGASLSASTTGTFQAVPPDIHNQSKSIEAGQDLIITLGAQKGGDDLAWTYTVTNSSDFVVGPASNQITFNSDTVGDQNLQVSVTNGTDTDTAIVSVAVLAVGSNPVPQIVQEPDQFVAENGVMTVQPSLSNSASAGTVAWFKSHGHDDVEVDPVTGEVSWDTQRLSTKDSHYVGVKCVGEAGIGYMSFIAHVGKSIGEVLYIGPDATYKDWWDAQPFMQAGYTAVLKDGVYTGMRNIIGRENDSGLDKYPPSGNSSVQTCVMAQTPVGAVFEGGVSGVYFSLWSGGKNESAYISLKGLFFQGGSTLAVTGDPNDKPNTRPHHIKVVCCGAEGEDDVGLYARVIDYITFESCFVFGGGRYKISVNEATNVAMRRNVARYDRSDRKAEENPKGSHICYNTIDFVQQNNVAVDDVDRFVNNGYKAGAFGTPVTGTNVTPEGSRGRVDKCLQLNSEQMCCQFDFQVSNGGGASDVEINDLVSYDTRPHNILIYSWGFNWWNRCTFAKYRPIHVGTTDSLLNTGDYPNFRGITDSLFHDIPLAETGITYIASNLTSGQAAVPYNGGTSRTVTKYGLTDINVSDSIGLEPVKDDKGLQNASNITNFSIGGDLKYVTRLEDTSNLSDSYGATLDELIGRSETFYGEEGYDEKTGIDMFPYPFENYIREKMKAYSWTGPTYSGSDYLNRVIGPTETLSGDRGFCVDGESLSSYVVGYIGNTVYPMNVKPVPRDAEALIVWERQLDAHKANVTAYTIYDYNQNTGVIDNPRVVAGNLDRTIVAGLINGFDSWFVMTCTDSVKGESGPTAPFKVRPNGVATIPPQFDKHPESQTVLEGETFYFRPEVQGADTLQWTKDNTDIADAELVVYTGVAALSDSGSTYKLNATNPVDTTPSNGAVLTVVPLDSTPPDISITLAGDVVTITLSDNIYSNADIDLQLLDGSSPVGDVFSGSSTSLDLTGFAIPTGNRTISISALDPQNNSAVSNTVQYTVGSPVLVDNFDDNSNWTNLGAVSNNSALLNAGSIITNNIWTAADKASIKFDATIGDVANEYEIQKYEFGVHADGTRNGTIVIYAYTTQSKTNNWVDYVDRSGATTTLGNFTGWGNTNSEVVPMAVEMSVVGTNFTLKVNDSILMSETLPETIAPFTGTMKFTPNSNGDITISNLSAYA